LSTYCFDTSTDVSVAVVVAKEFSVIPNSMQNILLDTPPTSRLNERFLLTTLQFSLLTYSAVVKSLFNLLSCVELGTESRLRIAGNIICFAGFQKGLFVLLVGISLLPLGISFVTIKTPRSYPVQMALSSVYKDHLPWWEGVLMIQRVVLIAIATFVLSPTNRLLVLTVVFVMILVADLRIAPYKNDGAQVLQSICLMLLVIIAVLELPTAVSTDYGHGIPKVDDITRSANIAQTVLACVPICLLPPFKCRNSRQQKRASQTSQSSPAGNGINLSP